MKSNQLIIRATLLTILITTISFTARRTEATPIFGIVSSCQVLDPATHLYDGFWRTNPSSFVEMARNVEGELLMRNAIISNGELSGRYATLMAKDLRAITMLQAQNAALAAENAELTAAVSATTGAQLTAMGTTTVGSATAGAIAAVATIGLAVGTAGAYGVFRATTSEEQGHGLSDFMYRYIDGILYITKDPVVYLSGLIEKGCGPSPVTSIPLPSPRSAPFGSLDLN